MLLICLVLELILKAYFRHSTYRSNAFDMFLFPATYSFRLRHIFFAFWNKSWLLFCYKELFLLSYL